MYTHIYLCVLIYMCIYESILVFELLHQHSRVTNILFVYFFQTQKTLLHKMLLSLSDGKKQLHCNRCVS